MKELRHSEEFPNGRGRRRRVGRGLSWESVLVPREEEREGECREGAEKDLLSSRRKGKAVVIVPRVLPFFPE